MTDQEFDVLEELYFVQSFEEVREATNFKPERLKLVLQDLMEKGWIRCLSNRQDSVAGEHINFGEYYQDYFYLATKAGLMAHNSR